jgi:type III secretory pathway component EscS
VPPYSVWVSYILLCVFPVVIARTTIGLLGTLLAAAMSIKVQHLAVAIKAGLLVVKVRVAGLATTDVIAWELGSHGRFIPLNNEGCNHFHQVSHSRPSATAL